ncbi:MAG: adenylate/guanylate cyclase domain-containing protein [Actinomycetes bacterium]
MAGEKRASADTGRFSPRGATCTCRVDRAWYRSPDSVTIPACRGGAADVEYARKGDTCIAFRAVGDGPVDLLFSAGLACHLDLLRGDPHADAFVRRLARTGRLLLFDKPGTGLSDPLSTRPTVADRAADHLAVLDAAGSERAVVIGFSEAVAGAAAFAATRPDRVEALVLLSGTVRPTVGETYLSELGPYMDDVVWRQLWHSARSWGDGSLALAVSPTIRASAVYRRLAPALERACASPGMARTIIEGFREYDALGALEEVRVPTLVVNRADEWVPAAVAVDHADRVPGAELAVLPGAEHMCYFGGDDLLARIERFVGGSAGSRSSRRDRRLLTILFTDIVGSTDTAVSLGDTRWRGLLAQHDSTTRDVVSRLGGRVVKSLGDGALSVFEQPATALEAALALHELATSLGTSLRAGVHTGECEVVDDPLDGAAPGDVAGVAVHLAARVAARAGAGETLATATVRDLVLGSDVRFESRGRVALKGLPGTWPLVAVVPGCRQPVAVPAEPPGLGDRALVVAAGRAPVVTRTALRVLGRVRSRRAGHPHMVGERRVAGS